MVDESRPIGGEKYQALDHRGAERDQDQSGRRAPLR